MATNIAIYSDSLTLMSVVFATFLHFVKNFGRSLEIPSEKKFSPISYFAYVKRIFLDLLSCKTKF